MEIDHESAVFPYRQLADQLRAAIERGDYAPGRAIPSIQELVRDTGLAIETIRRGIKVLVAEDLVYTVPGRGTFVSERED